MIRLRHFRFFVVAISILGFISQISVSTEFTVKPREQSALMSQCQECHDNDYASIVDRTPRKLTMMHEDIHLNHGNGQFWCLECHSPENNNHLKPGIKGNASFNFSVPVCQKCHGKVVRDWERGIHTKIKGGWNKPKQIYQCVECHSPHSPKFKKIKPFPKPHRPR